MPSPPKLLSADGPQHRNPLRAAGCNRFVDRAARHYVERQGRHSLREQLKAGYRANAERDLAMAAEWFPPEEEAWRTFEILQAEENRKSQTHMTFARRGKSTWLSSTPRAATKSTKRTKSLSAAVGTMPSSYASGRPQHPSA